MDENIVEQLRRLVQSALGSWGRALRFCLVVAVVALLAAGWKYAEHEWRDEPPGPLVCTAGADGQAHCQYVETPK